MSWGLFSFQYRFNQPAAYVSTRTSSWRTPFASYPSAPLLDSRGYYFLSGKKDRAEGRCQLWGEACLMETPRGRISFSSGSRGSSSGLNLLAFVDLFAQRRLSTTLALQRTCNFRCGSNVHPTTPAPHARLEDAGSRVAQSRSPTGACVVPAGSLSSERTEVWRILNDREREWY